ncbi:MAG: hypothetical protein KF726_23810 [Anaerolineae bacterium]|nr:hypothetical protein [Anaerolineae bacterium]
MKIRIWLLVVSALVFLTGSFAPVTAQSDLTTGTWREGAQMKVPRSEMSAVAIGALIYVTGGFSGENVLEVYDTASDSWSRKKAMPGTRHHVMSTGYEGKVYVFGGARSSRDWRPTNSAWVYDPAADTWVTLADMPEARSAGAAVTLDNYIYIVGGVGGTRSLLRYDPATDQWTRLAETIEPREHLPAVVLDGKIYALAGRWQGRGEYTSVEVYDPATDTWTLKVSMNEIRAGHGAAVIDGKIVAVGGEVWMSGSPVALDTVEVFDPATQTWSYASKMPVGLHGMPAISVADRLYVLGGSDLAAGIDNRGRVLIYEAA